MNASLCTGPFCSIGAAQLEFFCATTFRPVRFGITSSCWLCDSIVSLLQQSHELNRQFSLQAQYSLLRQQVNLASQVQPELARQWQSQLSLLAGQMKGPARSDAQNFAMTILARLDPDHAEELLGTMHLAINCHYAHRIGSRLNGSTLPHIQLIPHFVGHILAEVFCLYRYSLRRAFIGSMLEARRAGTKPATAAAIERTQAAIKKLSGSYAWTP